MGNKEQTVLLVSNDAGFCAAMRREFDSSAPRVRASAVSSVAAAWRILEEDSPGVILLEEDSVDGDGVEMSEAGQSLEAVVAPLAVHAPVVVIGPAEKRGELAGLIEAGAADFVERKTNAFAEARGLIQQRLRQALSKLDSVQKVAGESGEEDFGEVLRHELNNPLTGILGNAELLLAEIRRRKDGKVPVGGEQRLETIATLAVRLRETVRRLSEEWEARKHPVP
ncbi:MAG TPA: histidine kinase dimerization/phospho-acceptor domain-containing protein [Candidatus Acidoferrum sp.]|nr:histidine kinase dimerization/phospho-acceptor domain-containing protein [Candidatus Acidoferrum sp.]